MSVFMISYQVADGGVAEVVEATVARWAVGPAPAPRPFDVLGDYRMLG
ncbi:hypothetical protein [Streptosporangium canum]